MMGWYTDLSANIQTEIEKKTGMQIYFDVIVDPDGRAIRLDRLHDVERIGDMGISRSMEPGRDTVYKVDDITTEHNDPDNFFSPTESGGFFRDIRSYLRQDHSAGVKTLHLVKGSQVFEAGDVLRICSNGNTEEPIVESVDYSGATEDIVTLVSGLTYAHVGGTYVYTKHITGQSACIKLGFAGISDTITMFTGYLSQNIEREEGKAILHIRDGSEKTLKKNIVWKTSGTGDYYEHTYESSMLIYDPDDPQQFMGGYVRKDYNYLLSAVDIGTIDHTAITIYDGCPLGQWEVKFTSSTEFTVSGPGCFEKDGDTSTDFYDNTDATDSYIKIASTVWTDFIGTEGDWAKIYVCIHWIAKTGPQIIYDLLRFYGGVPTSKIDATSDFGGASGTHTSLSDDEPVSPDTSYSFDFAFKEREYERLSISFYEPITVLEAIIWISSHCMMITYPDRNETWKIHSQYPRPLESTIGAISDSTNLIDISVKDYPPVNGLTDNYAFKYRLIEPESEGGSEYAIYLAQEYRANYTYPRDDDDNQSFLRYDIKNNYTLNVPGIYTEALARALVSRYFILWKDGLREYTFYMNLQGINLTLGDRLALQCFDPDVDTEVEVTSVKFVPDRMVMEVTAFDTCALQEKFAVVDDTTERRGYSDEGFMVW